MRNDRHARAGQRTAPCSPREPGDRDMKQERHPPPVETASGSARHLHHPAPLVLRLAVLHRLQPLAQLVERLEAAELVLALDVGDGPDRRDDGGGAARANLAEGLELAPLERALLDGDAPILGDRHEHLVRDGGQDRARARRDVLSVFVNAKQVGDGKLLDVLVLARVEVEGGAVALALGVLERQQVGRVVAPRLDVARPLWRRAVELGHDLGVDPLDRALPKVVAHRDDRDEEGELGAGLQPEDGRRADQERPDVERAARAVRRHVLRVCAHRPVHRLNKELRRHRRHDEAVGAAL
mmetsp:Transcript_6894/g.22045  ORF Transcript_6894/g.22045 Transcript_6894/m.22045 type:complete len:297 (+) Transcript_6894:124-1014(+)